MQMDFIILLYTYFSNFKVQNISLLKNSTFILYIYKIIFFLYNPNKIPIESDSKIIILLQCI